MNFCELSTLVFTELENLDDRLYYHNIAHTRDDVLKNAILLAEEAQLNDSETLIVKTAALFHDTGFLDQYSANEIFGCKRARLILSEFAYTENQINEICDCIMATQMPQNPKTRLQQIVCDSDLGYLGSSSFIEKSNKLREEIIAMKNKNIGEGEWKRMNLEFLLGHNYFTPEAHKLFGQGKIKNLELVKRLIEQIEN